MPIAYPYPLYTHSVRSSVDFTFASGATTSDPDGAFIGNYYICGFEVPSGFVGNITIEVKSSDTAPWYTFQFEDFQFTITGTWPAYVAVFSSRIYSLPWYRLKSSQPQTAQRIVRATLMPL